MKQKVLLLHGWGGSDFPHWQSWLAGEIAKDYGEVCFPLLPSPHTPNRSKQLNAVKTTLERFEPDTVICHSLANVLWFHLCQETAIKPIKRLLLVAPPASSCDLTILKKFFPYTAPKDLFAEEALLVTSTTDPYLNVNQAKELQQALNIPMKVLENAGHINTDSGYGEWPWVREWIKNR